MIGDKYNTEALDALFIVCGRRAFPVQWRVIAIDPGALGSENADMSNDKTGEIPVRRKPKVSRATFFVPGLVGT